MGTYGTVWIQPMVAADSYGLTSGRLVSTSAALVALIGVVAGGLALASGSAPGRAGAGIGLGLIGVVVGGFSAATADGGLGTGSGLGGAVAAVALGLLAVVLGGLAQLRRRRAM
jgi:hypothetical protein